MSQLNFRSPIISLLIFLSGGFLWSCGLKTNVEVPAVTTPTVPDYKLLLQTCDKKDSEQPSVSEGVVANKIVVEDEIDSKDLEFIDCDGKVTGTEHGPERELNKFIEVEAPNQLPESVQYVSVENFRTCATEVFDAQDSEIGGEMMKLPHGKSAKSPYVSSAAKRNGKLVLNISDSSMKINIYLNVHDGNNVLRVRYFGKCLKLKDETDRNSLVSDDSYLNCAEGHEIGTKDVLLEVDVKRPDVPGKKQIRICNSK